MHIIIDGICYLFGLIKIIKVAGNCVDEPTGVLHHILSYPFGLE